MKILAVMGSPRKKGNGFKVIRQVEERMKTLGPVTFEYLYLKDVNLEMCRGCFLCVRKGKEKCPIKDEQRDLEAKILAQDGVIFYSPVYGMNVSALMKKFIDRFSYNGHHPQFFKQRALFVATTCGMGLRNALDAFKFLEGWGFSSVGELGVECPHYDLGEKAEQKQQRKIEQAADNLFVAIASGEMPKPKRYQVLHFNLVKMMCALPDMKSKFPRDVEYWTERGWLDEKARFFYDTEMPVSLKMYGFAVRALAGAIKPILSRN